MPLLDSLGNFPQFFRGCPHSFLLISDTYSLGGPSCGPPKFGGRVKRSGVRIPLAPHSSEVVYQTRWITEPSGLIVKA